MKWKDSKPKAKLDRSQEVCAQQLYMELKLSTRKRNKYYNQAVMKKLMKTPVACALMSITVMRVGCQVASWKMSPQWDT